MLKTDISAELSINKASKKSLTTNPVYMQIFKLAAGGPARHSSAQPTRWSDRGEEQIQRCLSCIDQFKC